MKKKLAIIFSRMSVGGAEKSLLQLLQAIDTDRYDVDLLTLDGNGAYFDEIPENVHVRFLACPNATSILKEDLKHLYIGRVIKGLFLRLMIRLCKDAYGRFALSMMACPKLPGFYDCAIAYKLGYEDTAVLLHRVDARKKAAWVHAEPDRALGTRLLHRSLRPLTKIFCVSETVKTSLGIMYPYLAERTEVFHNIVDAEQIRQKALSPIPDELHHPALVTVGRLAVEKGQDMVPKATRLLLDAGYKICWYLVGDGPSLQDIQQSIQHYGVGDHVFLLGTKENPFPYIQACDIYVQTSYTEGWCLTTQEAKILGKPIVTTDLPVMREQFTHYVNGMIAAATTPEALTDEIALLLDHPDICIALSNELRLEPQSGSPEIQKLYDYIDN